MLAKPDMWEGYYPGSADVPRPPLQLPWRPAGSSWRVNPPNCVTPASDRLRYYWPDAEIAGAVHAVLPPHGFPTSFTGWHAPS